MEITMFSNLVDAMDRVVNSLGKLAAIPQNERDQYLNAFRETYFLLNANLNMIILYLGDSRQLNDSGFKKWVSNLDNWNEWIGIERDFRLCGSLRDAYSKSQKLGERLLDPYIIQDWNAMLQQMQSTFMKEDKVAAYISKQFTDLAKKSGIQPVNNIRKEVEDFREALMKERSRLITNETKLFDKISPKI